MPVPSVQQDPLKFRDGRKYTDRLKDAKADTKLDDAVLVAEGTLEGRQIVVSGAGFPLHGGLARHGSGRSAHCRHAARG